jgi:ATP-dependent Clp protease ATP-binding subunit ClpC
VFERFSERARQVVVMAQEEARALRHNYIGTEHLLLGLLREDSGVAAQVLESLGVTVEEVRAQVAEIVGEGDEVTTGQIPFTPRAKKVLELSLREALSLGHNYIGTEHLLLGLARENDGVAARILLDFGANAETIWHRVTAVLASERGCEAVAAGQRHVASSTAVIRRMPRRVPRRVADYKLPSPVRMVVLGWALFGIAAAIGLLVGWLIWG